MTGAPMAKDKRANEGGQIRTFLAVEISDEVREAAADLISELDLPQYDVKWVRPRNIHVTIKFFGNIDPARVADIARVMEEVGREFRPFEISVERLGAFPGLRRPRVVWIGIGEGRRHLERLYREAEERLSGIVFPPEGRSFKSHLTIGRVRSPRGSAELVRRIERRGDFNAGRCKIFELVLFRSELKPGGPIYTALERRPLGK